MGNKEMLADKEIMSSLSALSYRERHRIISLLRKAVSREDMIPCYIFRTGKLSSLEAIVKYMKESLGLKHSEIASMLNRDSRTIWSTYRKARSKMPERFKSQQPGITIPIKIFRDRKLSVLETLVAYLKKTEKLSNKQIAARLNRKYRTILTVHSRYMSKAMI